jgi:hypothetical protein
MNAIFLRSYLSLLLHLLQHFLPGALGADDAISVLLKLKKITVHRKKGSKVSRPQPGCHYQTLPGRE